MEKSGITHEIIHKNAVDKASVIPKKNMQHKMNNFLCCKIKGFLVGFVKRMGRGILYLGVT